MDRYLHVAGFPLQLFVETVDDLPAAAKHGDRHDVSGFGAYGSFDRVWFDD